MGFSATETHSVIANLIKLAQTDGQMDPREVIYIQTIALKYQVSPADFQSIISGLDFAAGNLPSTEEGKLRLLYLALVGMNIDQNTATAEVDFCRRLGLNMYLPSDKVTKAIDYMVGNPQAVTSEEAFLAALN